MFLENFITGTMDKNMKQVYTYDAAGNVLSTTIYAPDNSGNYSVATTKVNTYDSHLAAVTLGEEAYLILNAEDASPNNLTKTVQTSSVTTITATITGQQFNAQNRPVKGILSLTPVPPGLQRINLLFLSVT